MPIGDLFKQCTGLRKRGKGDEALGLLRDALRRGGLTGEQIDKAGRFIQRELKDDAKTDPGAHRVLMLGQCTTTWVANALTAHAFGRGMDICFTDGEYDNVMQELLGAAAGGEKIDTVVFLPWHQRLFSGAGRSAAQRVEDEVVFWRQAWSIARDQLKARIIQVGYDFDTAGPLGVSLSGLIDGPVGLVREANRVLREALPKGAYFVDLEQVAGRMGRDAFYDARRYHWTKQPFSEAGTSLLGEYLASALRAVTVGPKKVLVLDLDNTLWGGVVGETGPLGITLGESPDGEAFRAFQKYVKGLAERGVLLAVCSKNNPDDAREPFEKNPDTVLKLDDFATFEASWDPKPVAIRRIAETLRLGLDSFVFFDDNPAEREHVMQMLPDVEVVNVPEDPSAYVRVLEAGLWFEAVEVTGADRERAEQYAVERQRRDAEQSFASVDDYLASLEMVGDVRDVDEADMQRVVQLLGKTNQFNLTTRRHTAEAVRAMLNKPNAVGITLRVSDKFGDHGLVSLILAVPGGDGALKIDTWLMSCRVISRTAEAYMFGALLARARQLGYKRLLGEYIPTNKNQLVADLYDRMGFERIAEHDGGRIGYALELADAAAPTTFIQPAEAAHR
jgi:FkbH-like protein